MIARGRPWLWDVGGSSERVLGLCFEASVPFDQSAVCQALELGLGQSAVTSPEALSHPGDGRDRCSVSAERFLFLDPPSYRHLDS